MSLPESSDYRQASSGMLLGIVASKDKQVCLDGRMDKQVCIEGRMDKRVCIEGRMDKQVFQV